MELGEALVTLVKGGGAHVHLVVSGNESLASHLVGFLGFFSKFGIYREVVYRG